MHIISSPWLKDFSDDEGDASEKEKEEPDEWGKFLHLKERVGKKRG